ncbi:hypothetical protein EJ04DRAFT_512014 [Polyplosphaeria fusca]|uniref:Uncharacterized protein n=1 Tax=Polyplosphaeria fusca TaxID=682080 RepID=A0A9P4R1C8_9PLEO|nr:hypothetical protein EJ04DRAFT_512014 [Polyplosphaeria fusca]
MALRTHMHPSLNQHASRGPHIPLRAPGFKAHPPPTRALHGTHAPPLLYAQYGDMRV